MNNINPKTGIAYGYIAAQALGSELVHELMDGTGAERFVNHSHAYFEAQYRREHELDDADELPDDAYDVYEPYEDEVEGVIDGVHYASSWLGGALNFFILESPVTTDKARMASPCVPNAGILDTLDGSVTSYDVPADWRYDPETD